MVKVSKHKDTICLHACHLHKLLNHLESIQLINQLQLVGLVHHQMVAVTSKATKFILMMAITVNSLKPTMLIVQALCIMQVLINWLLPPLHLTRLV